MRHTRPTMTELGSRGRSIRRVSTPPPFSSSCGPGTWPPSASCSCRTDTGTAGRSFPDYGGSTPASAFNPTNYGYFWWIEPTTGVTAYYAWGFAGQLIEVVPDLHLVIVVSSNVDETRPGAPVVGPDEAQHLVDAIVPIIKTHPTR